MKIGIIANEKRYRKFAPKGVIEKHDVAFYPLNMSQEELSIVAKDREILLVDAIAEVSGDLIDSLKDLKMIHSEGVAFNKIDIQKAREKGIDVCNNKGVNAASVAEQTILLMLGLLRSVLDSNQAVLDGHQIQRKEKLMLEGIMDLSDCVIGLIGFGDIAQATAKLLNAFGCKVYYYSKHKKVDDIESEYNVTYLPLNELLSTCDIVSLHMAVNEETKNFMNKDTLSLMKDHSILINTARGELIDQEALVEALKDKSLYFGADTLSPEPVQKDNVVVQYAQNHSNQVLLLPHTGGVTTTAFKRMHQRLWENVQRVEKGEKPIGIVNK